MGTAPTADWIELFGDTVHATMRRAGCARNACLEAACVAVGVARLFGYRCEPVPVDVLVVAGRQATIVGGRGPRLDGDGKYNGHLVVHFPGADEMLDLTSDQFHDPGRGLHVPAPISTTVPRAELALGIRLDLPDPATSITYQETDDGTWRTLPGWAEPSPELTLLAVRAMLAAVTRP